MKLISWNVNGLRACVGKGFKEAFAQLDADFFCLQETKMQEGQLDLAFPGYHSYWNSAEKKGYSGTAVFTRHEPLSVTKGIGIEVHDHEGRVLTLEMADFFLVCVYTPNSQDQLRRLSYRMQWEEDFQAYLHRLDSQKPVIVCGDLNVAHEEIDIKNPRDQPPQRGLHRRGARKDDDAAQKWLHRLLPQPLPHAGDLLLVVVPLSCAREERRVAYRLLPPLRPTDGADGGRKDPHRDLRFGPLPHRA